MEGNIGSSGKYDLSFVEGKLKITMAYADGDIAGAVVELSLGAAAVLDALAAAIPGKIDDEIFGLMKEALKI